MSKFCTTCGASMKDDVGFCTSCGTKIAPSAPPVTTQEAPVQQAYTQAPVTQNPAVAQETPIDAFKNKITALLSGPDRNKLIGIAAAFVAVLIVVVLVLTMSGGYKKPIRNYIKGVENADYDKYVSAYAEYEQDTINERADQAGGKKTFMKNRLKGMEEELGDDIKISYSILDKTKLDKDDIDDLEDSIKENYDEKVEIKKGYNVCVKATYKGDDDKEIGYITYTVVKIDGDWYFCD